MAPSFDATSLIRIDWTAVMSLGESLRRVLSSLKDFAHVNNAPSLQELAALCRGFLGRVLKARKSSPVRAEWAARVRFQTRRQFLLPCRHGPLQAV
ncbi:hypothetical protein IAD21_00915 [Abditibacteriota bacterium]|nr:hypothetical protein IAD21_00915 [Abditibacteriota bacterium]